jgi:hypothetical protein
MRTQVGEEKWENMREMKDENKEDNKKKRSGRRELKEDVIC